MAQGYRKTKAVLSLIAGGALLAGAGGFWWFRQVGQLRQERDTERLTRAQDALEAGDPRQALVYVPSAFRMAGMDELRIRTWQKVELDAAEKARDIERLVKLYGQIPEEVLKKEEASLLVARFFMHINDGGEYSKIREAWKGREAMPEGWFVMEADQFLVNKDKVGAMEHLRSQTFPGAKDAGRLMRMAMIAGESDTDEAQDFLDQARNAAPAQPDVHFFLADFYEKTEKLVPARIEYLLALSVVPGNIFFGDQLAEFYRRQGNTDLAMHTWGSLIDQPFSEPVWMKLLFWSRVMKPSTVDLTKCAVPTSGPVGSIVGRMAEMPADVFWKDQTEEPAAGTASQMIALQCVYWLQLLERLRTKDEAKSADLMELNPNRSKSWKPGLERALIRVLHYRQKKTLQLPGERQDVLPPQDEKHPLFLTIEEAAKKERDDYPSIGVSPATDQLLTDERIFAWLFQAAGWAEAGRRLGEGLKPLGEGSPVAAEDGKTDVTLPEGSSFAPVASLNESAVDRIVRACREENWSEVHHAVLEFVERSGDFGKASRELRAVEAQFGGAP